MSMDSRLRILHLEDDPKDAEIIQGVLELGGIDCDVARVATRADFVAALESAAFDLILADFTLPDFDGLSAIKIALQRCPEVPVIFVSGMLGEEVAIEALKIGATDYVLKERLSRIVSSVQRALREARDRAQRVLAEQQLLRSQAFLEEGQRISHTGSWGWTLATGKVIWSNEQFRMFGFVPGAVEPSVELFLSAVHPEDRTQIGAELEQAMQARQAYSINYRVLLPDGSLRHMRSVGRPVLTGAGSIEEFIGTTTDTTERMQVEMALKRSEERYALAMGAACEGLWDWDIERDEFYASPRLLQMYGFAADQTFASRQDFLAEWPIHPEDRPRLEAAVAAHWADATADFDIEIRILSHGQTQWMQLRGLCSRNAGGTPIRWTGTARDITDRKQMELALRRSSERYALAVEAAGEGHSDWNLETGEYHLSPRLLEICGYPPDAKFRDRAEWIARFPFHPDDRPKWEKAIAVHMASAASRFLMEVRIVVRGETRWVRFVFLCSRDAAGKPVRWTGSTTDVTERRRAEEELRERQEMLDLAQKVARAVAFEWSICAGANRWSPELDALHGVAPGSHNGSLAAWKNLVDTEDRSAVEDALVRATQSGDLAVEYRVGHGAGALRWLQVKGRMFFDDQSQPARIVGFMIDVTERRQAEEELRRLESRLRQSQRLEAMGTLAGGIAHDFNNILGAILGYGERAMREAPRASRLRRDLESILAAGERGRALVDRVLMFSRSGVGERIAVHVEGVVREALDLLSAKLPGNIIVETDLRAGRAAMLGDATQIHQLLMNLATNSIQAMAAGGTLRVSLSTVRIEAPRALTIGAISSGDYIILEISDSGTGIAPELLERIFDPFFTTKEVGVGTGLGLSLVHGIVLDVGGAIDLVSKVGAGTAFAVYLPHSGEARARVQGVEEAVPQGAGQRVLVVDDEELLVRLATETLAELGYSPVGFTSSEAALNAFRADPNGFDAVITDERMPGISGSALIREVRSVRRALPILLISGNVGGMVTNRAYNAGADEVLKKPLTAYQLATSLARVLQEWESCGRDT